MLERGPSRTVHEVVTGRGRMCCATARAYCEVDVLRGDLHKYWRVVWISECPINFMSAGRLMPARIMSEAKVVRLFRM